VIRFVGRPLPTGTRKDNGGTGGSRNAA
jgi:hypothetical protein